ncbi:MAG: hypothetical protein M1815_003638 [Lichina confinis]|nr:MAG: hypothetical protein M1815_003638 [Lichina confinis]
MVAKGKGIWDYINPEMFQELCPILIKPEEPAFSELHANAALYIDLDATECEVYKFMYQKYKTNYDEYKYQKLKKAPQSKNLETWLHSWEKMYKDALDIDLPDVQGNRPVKDFV